MNLFSVLVRLLCSFIHRAAFKHLKCSRHYRNIRNDYVVSVLQESLFKCPVGSLVVQSTSHYYTLADCHAESCSRVLWNTWEEYMAKLGKRTLKVSTGSRI